MNINRYFDHTLLRSDARLEDISNLCAEAKQYQFASVCVNPAYVSTCVRLLQDTPVKVCTVVGFPLGTNDVKVKVLETEIAIHQGAEEIDMVINVGKLLDGDYAAVLEEIMAVRQACYPYLLKVILETSFLDDEAIVKGVELAIAAKADYVKTSTGFNGSVATLDAVRLMKKVAQESIKIKASGGIRDYATFQSFQALGVHRIGTSSAVKIMHEAQKTK